MKRNIGVWYAAAGRGRFLGRLVTLPASTVVENTSAAKLGIRAQRNLYTGVPRDLHAEVLAPVLATSLLSGRWQLKFVVFKI